MKKLLVSVVIAAWIGIFAGVAAGADEPSKAARDAVASGRAKQKEGDLDGALADYTRAIEMAPRFAEAFFKRGDAKEDKGDLDGALTDLTRAIEIDPRYASAYQGRAHVKDARGDLDGALADYDRAIEIDPKYYFAYSGRGFVKNRKGDLDGAIADFTRAMEIDPRNANAAYKRGDAKLTKGDLDGAIADFTRALELNPRHAWAYARRGDARKAKGDPAGARADHARARELDPSAVTSGADAAPRGDPAVGTWRGTAIQPGARPYEVVMTIEAGGHGSNAYPTLNATGKLVGGPGADGTSTYAETIVTGRATNEHGGSIDGTITFRLVDDRTMTWNWTGTWEGRVLTASATLKRDGAVTPSAGDADGLEAVRGSWGADMGHRELSTGIILEELYVEVPRTGPWSAAVRMDFTVVKATGRIPVTIHVPYTNGRRDGGSVRFDKVPWSRTVPSTGQKDELDGNPLVLRVTPEGKLAGVFEGDDGWPFEVTRVAGATAAKPPPAGSSGAPDARAVSAYVRVKVGERKYAYPTREIDLRAPQWWGVDYLEEDGTVRGTFTFESGTAAQAWVDASGALGVTEWSKRSPVYYQVKADDPAANEISRKLDAAQASVYGRAKSIAANRRAYAEIGTPRPDPETSAYLDLGFKEYGEVVLAEAHRIAKLRAEFIEGRSALVGLDAPPVRWQEIEQVFVKESFAETQATEYGFTRAGKRNGLWNGFYADGSRYFKGEYRAGKQHGVHRVWHRNGKPKLEIAWLDDRQHGPMRTWYENGQQSLEQPWSDGHKNGLRREWYEDGTPKAEEPWRDGKLQGFVRTYFRNGRMEFEAEYKDGELDGRVRTWYASGQLHGDGQNRRNKQHGHWRTWGEDGRLEGEGDYVDGKRVR